MIDLQTEGNQISKNRREASPQFFFFEVFAVFDRSFFVLVFPLGGDLVFSFGFGLALGLDFGVGFTFSALGLGFGSSFGFTLALGLGLSFFFALAA